MAKLGEQNLKQEVTIAYVRLDRTILRKTLMKRLQRNFRLVYYFDNIVLILIYSQNAYT